MSDTERNKQIARRLVEEGFNKGNTAVIDQLLAENYVYYEPTVGEKRGPRGFVEVMTMYRTAFPDARMAIKEEISEGDKVVVHWTGTGTHRGDLMGISPTGKQVTVEGVSIIRISGGKIVEDYSNYDALGMMLHLGAVVASQEFAA